MPESVRQLLDAPVMYESRKIDDRTVHILAEKSHYTRAQVDKVHTDLVPLLAADPSSWLLLREGATMREQRLFDFPSSYYFQELASFFRVPYKEAIPELDDEETREYITGKTQLPDEDLDWFVHTATMVDEGVRQSLSADGLNDYVRTLQKNLKRPHFNASPEYVRKIIGYGLMSDELFLRIGQCWNELVQKNFHKLLCAYPDKTNIIVSVGSGHAGAFQ